MNEKEKTETQGLDTEGVMNSNEVIEEFLKYIRLRVEIHRFLKLDNRALTNKVQETLEEFGVELSQEQCLGVVAKLFFSTEEHILSQVQDIQMKHLPVPFSTAEGIKALRKMVATRKALRKEQRKRERDERERGRSND